MAISDCKVPTYQNASWKNVPFNVESSSDEFGRRGDLYEYPLSEETAYKDLGRKARRFRVEGYLIGGEQVALTQRMKTAAESPEPGTLVHPMYGSQKVACVTLTATAEYKKDKRRTKLSFEFVEANTSMSPYKVGDKTPGQVQQDGSKAVEASKDFGSGSPDLTDPNNINAIDTELIRQIQPATDEASHDATDALSGSFNDRFGSFAPPRAAGRASTPVFADTGATTSLFRMITDPIDNGTATILRIHDDALARLRSFNRFVVLQSAGSADVETVIITTRLALIRDFATKATMTRYKTIRDALADLDFVMAVYDDEENAATAVCADALVTAIRQARATAAQAILSTNIRLPGVVQTGVDGVWPSLVAAHKIYFDGRRYGDVEKYNPQMPPFFIGRDVVSPAPPEP